MSKFHWRERWQSGPVTVLMLGAGILLLAACEVGPKQDSAPSASDSPNPQRLLGAWVRPDGGYVLEISRVHSGGKLEVAYLNPRPIRVATAELKQEGREMGVFIELRDRGYPGSYYELTYNAKDDLLVGNYFQAAQQTFYEVVFVRRPTR